MKSIIDGFRYDTEKAEKVAEYSYGNSGDFSHQEFGIYRTPRGHWFLAGSGGPLTRFARSAGQNQMTGGSRIIRLNVDQLLDLIEQIQDSAEDIEKVFDYPEVMEQIKDA